MAPNSEFYVLVGDLVASRRAPARRSLTQRLERALADSAQRFPWQAPLMSTRGLDEISGVLSQPSTAFDVCVALNEALWPQRFRFALACGAIDVAPGSAVAADMDGPAFHRAADALSRGRATDLPFTLAVPPAQPAACAMAEALGALHGTLMRQWSPGAARAVEALRHGGSQSAAAAALGITQQAVSGALARAHQRKMEAAQAALRNWLGTLEAA